MILLDTSVLSTLARVNELDLVWELFPKNSIAVAPAVFREVMQAVAQGRSWLEQIPKLVESGRLQLAMPTAAEVLAAEAFPDSLGLGEREAIALCKAHDWVFLTNDRRARNFCAEIRVEASDVAGVMRLLWTTGVRSQKFVRRLLARMEQAEGLRFKNKDMIFKAARKPN
jgi:predicted nucleic acid-binding protein